MRCTGGEHQPGNVPCGGPRRGPARPGYSPVARALCLRDGTPALIGPLLPTGAETLRELLRHLSPQSQQRRFLPRSMTSMTR